MSAVRNSATRFSSRTRSNSSRQDARDRPPSSQEATCSSPLAPHLALEGAKTNRVFALLAKSPVFAGFVMHPLVMAFVEGHRPSDKKVDA